MEETWKDVIGYESLYQVSNLGRIKSLSRKFNCNKGMRFIKDKILKPQLDYHGYHRIELSKFGKTKKYFIHQLVAMAFIPNPNREKIINHKDGNKINNQPNNIEWCDYSYNEKYSYRVLGKKTTCPGKGKFAENSSQSKPITQYSKSGKIIAHYVSLKSACDYIEGVYSSIAKAAQGTRNTYRGFVWKYDNTI